jgi:hypothetical protein
VPVYATLHTVKVKAFTSPPPFYSCGVYAFEFEPDAAETGSSVFNLHIIKPYIVGYLTVF